MSNCLIYDNYELAQQTLVLIVTFNLPRFIALDTYLEHAMKCIPRERFLPLLFFVGRREELELQDIPTTAEFAGEHHVKNIFCLLALPSIKPKSREFVPASACVPFFADSRVVA